MSAQPIYSGRAIALRGLLILAVTAVIVLGFMYLKQARARSSNASASFPEGAIMASPFFSPGIDSPHTCPADEAPLRDNDEVIGIALDSKARAYLVSAFAGFQHHVVNDVLAGEPISVTHCDLHNCTRVFTGSEPDKPLPLSCGGRAHGGGLLLLAPGGMFDQETGDSVNPGGPGLPFEQVPFVVTTWAEWKRAHPNTDVYVGEIATPQTARLANIRDAALYATHAAKKWSRVRQAGVAGSGCRDSRRQPRGMNKLRCYYSLLR